MPVWKLLLPSLLLACLLLAAGCSDTKHAPAAAPAPAVPDTPPAAPVPPTPAMAAATAAASYTPFVTETPYQGHPYSKTYSFSGTGDFVQEFTTDSSREWDFSLSCTGAKEIFLATVKNEAGDSIALLANEPGPYSGKKTVQLSAGHYYLDVASDAPWTITMSTV